MRNQFNKQQQLLLRLEQDHAIHLKTGNEQAAASHIHEEICAYGQSQTPTEQTAQYIKTNLQLINTHAPDFIDNETTTKYTPLLLTAGLKNQELQERNKALWPNDFTIVHDQHISKILEPSTAISPEANLLHYLVLCNWQTRQLRLFHDIGIGNLPTEEIHNYEMTQHVITGTLLYMSETYGHTDLHRHVTCINDQINDLLPTQNTTTASQRLTLIK